MKIFNNRLLLVAVSGAIIGTTGCKKLSDFGDTNVNPAATTSPITSALLTNVLSQLGSDAVTGGFGSNDKAGIFAQYFAEATYPSISFYAVPQVEFDGTYNGPLYDLQNIINVSTSDAEKATARIVKAYIFWRTTDRFGDIPYFNALKGNSPTYDKQELIYKDMIKELTEAVDQMDLGGVIKGDILYGNDPAKWKKLANSLRMTMALRLSNRFPGASDYAATQFKAALAAGGIESNADNWKLDYPGTTTAFSNPFYNSNFNNRDYGVSEPFGEILTTLGDTRASVYGSSTVYVPYGLKEADINAWRSAHPSWARTMAASKRATTSPIYLMTAARTYLVRAEAAVRGWTTETAADVYASGIDRSFTQWGLTTPAGYVAQPGVALSGSGDLGKIATQQFIEGFPDGTEGWSVWRRTGFPDLDPTPNPSDGAHTTIPVRYTYGQRQLSLNPVGVAAAALSQGPDKQETKVWWDL